MVLDPLKPKTLGQPCYEIIKREDLVAAFREAQVQALSEVLGRIDELIHIFVSVQPSALWVWGYSSRWGYDCWW